MALQNVALSIFHIEVQRHKNSMVCMCVFMYIHLQACIDMADTLDHSDHLEGFNICRDPSGVGPLFGLVNWVKPFQKV